MTTVILPQFTNIDIKNFVNHFELLLKENLQTIEACLQANQVYTWDNLMQVLEDLEDRVERTWSPVGHLHAVVNSPALRECYQAVLPKLSEYHSTLSHHRELYEAILSLQTQPLTPVQKKIIDDILLDFKLSGVALSKLDQARFKALQKELSALENKFETQVLDATEAFHLPVSDISALEGLPPHAIEAAQQLALEKNLKGFLLSLEAPTYLAVMTHAEDRALRKTIYEAYLTRASEIGPQAGQFDNGPIMNDILRLRKEKAQLLGFANYAALSVASKMANSEEEVNDFLEDLLKKLRKSAERDYATLKDFAKSNFGFESVFPWDIAYLSEKKREAAYALNSEMLRPYFPAPKVLEGLFEITERLFGIKFEKLREDELDLWHKDVSCYRLLDAKGNQRGYIYMDLFARAGKRGGAWMDSLQSRRLLADGSVQVPIATLTCNFAKPKAGQVATFSHDEVITLFHECGHCLHHVLTQVDYLTVSGIHGVEWDAVELPSQFFENWCWQQEALDFLSAHVETKAPLPATLLEKLLEAKNFQSAMALIRQLEFALFDFSLHQQFDGSKPDFVNKLLDSLRQRTAVTPLAAFNRFANSFTHIFAGGYAAGYYSYLWAEVLSSDAFMRFEEEGIFNKETGQAFLKAILEVGGSQKAAEAYQQFRGRPATITAFLKHNGI